jgi:hypothetical protein
MSIAQQLEARGEARAMRASLEAVLAARFGPVPEAIRQAIAAADAETVSAWIPRAANAATLTEVGITVDAPSA